jgi:hypothetical protein
VRTAAPSALPSGTAQHAGRPPAPREALYDLSSDPNEMTDLAARRPQVRARLAARTTAWLESQMQRRRALPRAPPTVRNPPPDEEARFQDRLRALGYLD